MKLIHSSFEILEQKPGLEGIYEAIETAGRTCYKSSRPEGKTAKDFVDMLIKRQHLSPLEHGTVYLKHTCVKSAINVLQKYKYNQYSKLYSTYEGLTITYYVTTNMRVLHENDWLDDLKYLCEPTEYHERRVGVRVNCSISISREWNRHRTFSVCERSTRYCNFSKDRFNNELTFIIPSWVGVAEGTYNKPIGQIFPDEYVWLNALADSEERYLNLIKHNMLPQQAREVLPLATATEVVYTGYTSDWKHFFDMRCDKSAHPDIRKLAIPLKEEFIKRGLL